MDPTHQGAVQVKAQGMLQRWKKQYGAVFTGGRFGVARLELYASAGDFAKSKHPRSILLDGVLSVRSVDTDSGPPAAVALVLSVQGKQTQLLLGAPSQNQGKMWQDALSRAAFPSAYDVLGGAPAAVGQRRRTSSGPGLPPQRTASEEVHRNALLSPSVLWTPADTGAYDDPWDLQVVRVLLLPTASVKLLGLREGPYDLCLGPDAMLLRKAEGSREEVERWSYEDVTWFGYGDRCCAFESEGSQSVELKVSKPDEVYERIRSVLRLRPSSDPSYRPHGLVQAYYASYVRAEGPAKPQRLSLIPEEERRTSTLASQRSIFAPRASVDTALPNFYRPKDPSPKAKEAKIKRRPSFGDLIQRARKKSVGDAAEEAAGDASLPAQPREASEKKDESKFAKRRSLRNLFGSRRKTRTGLEPSLLHTPTTEKDPDWSFESGEVLDKSGASDFGFKERGAETGRGQRRPSLDLPARAHFAAATGQGFPSPVSPTPPPQPIYANVPPPLGPRQVKPLPPLRRPSQQPDVVPSAATADPRRPKETRDAFAHSSVDLPVGSVPGVRVSVHRQGSFARTPVDATSGTEAQGSVHLDGLVRAQAREPARRTAVKPTPPPRTTSQAQSPGGEIPAASLTGSEAGSERGGGLGGTSRESSVARLNEELLHRFSQRRGRSAPKAQEEGLEDEEEEEVRVRMRPPRTLDTQAAKASAFRGSRHSQLSVSTDV